LAENRNTETWPRQPLLLDVAQTGRSRHRNGWADFRFLSASRDQDGLHREAVSSPFRCSGANYQCRVGVERGDVT